MCAGADLVGIVLAKSCTTFAHTVRYTQDVEVVDNNARGRRKLIKEFVVVVVVGECMAKKIFALPIHRGKKNNGPDSN